MCNLACTASPIFRKVNALTNNPFPVTTQNKRDSTEALSLYCDG